MKTLCKKLDKLEEKPEKYFVHVVNPTFVCKRCGRATNNKEMVCKPIPIEFKENTITTQE